jgi:PAS domain
MSSQAFPAQAVQLFRYVFDQASLGMAVEDLEGKLLLANPALCSMLGYPEEELCGCRTALKSRNFAVRPHLLHLKTGIRSGLCTLIPDERTCSGTVKSVNHCVHVDEVPS